jgi:glycosyltransferase involved in cell wall biosynthesis
MRFLFVDPFFDGSHRAFGEGLAAHSRHEFVFLVLPGGEWRRRMRLGAQELARAATAVEGQFDALVATDMLDLPAFLALTRPRFGRAPALVYFHENQLTYPRIRGTRLNSWFGAINYLSALAADAVAFNSAYHRADFLGALRTLEGQPSNWLDGQGIAAIEAKAAVLPVGVDLSWAAGQSRAPDPGPPIVVWNHRWEFDKAPDVFARAVIALAGEGLAFRLALAGEPGPNPHPAMAEVRDRLGGRVVHFGLAATRDEYLRLLQRSAVVVSTTRHEFFGVGMVEALAAGCLPVAPRRFNYPALVPEALHQRYLWDDEEGLRVALARAIAGCAEGSAGVEDDRALLRSSAMRFDWSRVAPEWDAALEAFVRAET